MITNDLTVKTILLVFVINSFCIFNTYVLVKILYI